MDNDKILHFISEKIEDLSVAIFYCYSNSPLKINNTIIHTSKVDNCGSIYFLVKRQGQLVREFEQEFPAALNYFKKGKNYFLNVFGKARIINDPEELAYQAELTAEEINNALTTHVLIKVSIIKVDFYDNEFEKKNLILKKLTAIFSKLFNSVGITSGTYNFNGGIIYNYGF